MILTIIEQLKQIRQRPVAFLTEVTPETVENFLNGFDQGLFSQNLRIPLEYDRLATEQRGWPWDALGPIRHMKAAGLESPAIVDELLSIKIEAWQLIVQKGSENSALLRPDTDMPIETAVSKYPE